MSGKRAEMGKNDVVHMLERDRATPVHLLFFSLLFAHFHNVYGAARSLYD